MNQGLRGFRVKSNTGFHGVNFRRAGLMVAAKGGVYPFAAVTYPAYSWKKATVSITSLI